MSLDILRAQLALFVEFDPRNPKSTLAPQETLISPKNVEILLNVVNDLKNAPKQKNGADKPVPNDEVAVAPKLKHGDQSKVDSVELSDVTFYAGFAEQAAAEGLVTLPGEEDEPKPERKPRQSTRVQKAK